MSNSPEHIIVAAYESQLAVLLNQILRSAGFTVTLVQIGSDALSMMAQPGISLIILGENLKDSPGIDLAEEISHRYPSLPVIMFVSLDSIELLKRAIRLGVSDVITPPLKTDEVLHIVRTVLDQVRRRKESIMLEMRRFTSTLQRQVDEMEALTRLGRQITSSLSIDSVLMAVVDAAVELTGAEEGSLMLVDEASGELYVRASRNLQEDFVRTFRLPVTDSLAGSVIRSGEAILFDENTPQKIKTSYLVQSLLYAPLQLHGHVFGILGVDNRHSRLPLTQRHVKLLETLAGYAVIALENARLYNDATAERNKLETILSEIQDGVIVVNDDQRLAMVNKAARQIFNIGQEDDNLEGLPFHQVFNQPGLLDLLAIPEDSPTNRTELSPGENNDFSVQIRTVPNVGKVFTLHDITNFKNLDRIKTEFVHTVSHDLRSPLTAILGYVELIGRAGPVTDLQRDFIRRVQVSVQNITHLVDNLLDLGRIESGFDLRKENVQIDQLVHFSADGMKKRLAEKGIHLQITISPDIPPILANPVQLRQMIDHLLDNAIKYTIPGGEVFITGQLEQNQLILQFKDTGIGIPAMDMPYLFDKFYRAANASSEMAGTGLGLAIVKSIVENHGGRIWVDSMVGKGATFTLVLPLDQA